MKSLIAFLMCVGVGGAVGEGVASPASTAAATERVARRVLLISAPSVGDERYRTQAAELLAAWGGLAERDFEVRTEFGEAVFSVVLIGKDGGEKLRRDTPLTTVELFEVVDAMPMRRAELRERKNAPDR